MKKSNFKLILFALLLLPSFLTSGCAGLSKKPLTYTDTVFDTVIQIQIFDSADENLLEHCKKLCRDFEKKLSPTIETSEIAQINRAKGKPVSVSEDTARLIKKGLYYGKLTNGALDITIGSVSSLWDFKSENPAPPSKERLQEASSHVDYKKVSVKDNVVVLQDSKAALDIGAVAKGYIADRLKAYLKKEGVRHALINLGGNVLAIGGKPDGSPFNIGIQKPFDKGGEALTSVKIKDKSIVTSGTYQRYFKTGGKFYHHILNPSSGMPCENGLNSVTIITDSSLAADALSTSCFVLGPEKGMKLINQLDNVDAVFVNTKNEITYSHNFMK